MGELAEGGKRAFGRLFGVIRGGDEADEVVESEESDAER
jgi:hypothetical protein